MKLYEGKNYKLYHGSMLDMPEVIENGTIDSIVTDPPYELNFMNKGWDNSGIAFSSETWKRCFDALKPGGYLLAFGGSRTYHRIACAIEDAGFEIRDTIMWLYGCYSADTQVLTNEGWKYFYDLNKTEKVLQWNKDNNELSWVKPLNYFEYEIEDDMKLFENRHISQLVTKNHKIVADIKKRRSEFCGYQLIEAKDIEKSWVLNFPLAGYMDGEKKEESAYIIGWWLTDAWKHNDGKAVMFSQSKEKTLNKLRKYFDDNNIKYSEYIKKAKSENHKDEHTFYVTGEIADFLISHYPDRRLNWDMLSWDRESKLALIEGLMDGDGTVRENSYSRSFWSKKQERLDIFQALCISVGYRAYINSDKGCVQYNIAKSSTQIQKRHRKEDLHYSGKVYCLETKTGAFVVRRNGKAFISGNSGFPKSMNIGKAVESKILTGSANTQEFKNLQGTKAVANNLGFTRSQFEQGARPNDYGADGHERTVDVDYQTEEGERWNGWGTALKPSYEPIIVARKPCEGSCVDNVLKYGVGGMNIDECRVGNETIKGGTAPSFRDVGKKSKENIGIDKLSFGQVSNAERIEYADHQGRFPANTILTYDDTDFYEVCGGMPDTKNATKTHVAKNSDTNVNFNASKNVNVIGYDDNGSASRYFYCAKASKRDRDEGINGRNRHCTVKPTTLMQYLVRLVTPNGGTVLDPFNGSGSTGKAVMYENIDRDADYKYIGFEITEEYIPIAIARIEYAQHGTRIEDFKPKNDEQLTIFDFIGNGGRINEKRV